MALVSQLNKFADKETLIQFLRCFLLESNSSAVRWQAHCLALHIYRYGLNTYYIQKAQAYSLILSRCLTYIQTHKKTSSCFILNLDEFNNDK